MGVVTKGISSTYTFMGAKIMNRSGANSKAWLRDFEDFVKSPEHVPPTELSNRFLAVIRRKLDPPTSLVFTKAIAIQGITAFILLLFCPQLGVGPLLGHDIIMDLFMHFGSIACSAFCGALFLGSGTMVLCLFLKSEELRVAYKNRIIGVPLLTALSLSGLMVVGGEADQWAYIYWSLGATIGSYLMLSTGTKLRLAMKPNALTVQ